MSRHNKQHLGSLSELNITPLIDLAFVLLIIFMITAPFLAGSADVEIPTTKAARPVVNPEETYVISITSAGEMQLRGQKVSSVDNLVIAIAQLMVTEPDLTALIEADKDLRVQRVVEIMDALRMAKVSKVGLITKADSSTWLE